MVYSRKVVDVAALPDVVHTWECFGASVSHDDPEYDTSCGPAQPLILVKVKVFDVFRRLKVKYAEFSPVRFV